MFKYAVHSTLQAACHLSTRQFYRQRNQLERVQRAQLKRLLTLTAAAGGLGAQGAIPSWEAYRDKQPLTHYADWQDAIAAQRSGTSSLIDSPLVRYQPTSGSSEKLKLIPYSKLFLGELDAAICPWISSLYRNHPAIKSGVHYWSVSWLPQNQFGELRGNLNDDSELLGGVKSRITARSQAVPAEVALAASATDSMFATLCYLVAAADLTVMSVWSPTFALQLLDMLLLDADEIARVLERGSWGERLAALRTLTPPLAPARARLLRRALRQSDQLIQLLWPQLALISAWDTADAASWAQQLQRRVPQAAFEGKGLWATEGVVTIPVDGVYPLAYRSHVYEFEDLGCGEIKAPWELQEGDEVSPILSGGNGLLRYALDDRLVVSGFWGDVPCFSFIGRRHGVDLVGEKMSPEAARKVLQEVASQFDLEPVTLLALSSQVQGQSSYVALFNHAGQTRLSEQVSRTLEQILGGHFHYALARDLKQLAPAKALLAADGWALNKRIAMAAGMIEGNIKPEAIRKVSQELFWQVLDGCEASA